MAIWGRYKRRLIKTKREVNAGMVTIVADGVEPCKEQLLTTTLGYVFETQIVRKKSDETLTNLEAVILVW